MIQKNALQPYIIAIVYQINNTIYCLPNKFQITNQFKFFEYYVQQSAYDRFPQKYKSPGQKLFDLPANGGA